MKTALRSARAIATELAARVAVLPFLAGQAGKKVYRGRQNIATELMPCVSIVEGADEPNEQAEGQNITDVRLTQRYVLIGFLPCDADNPNDAAHDAIEQLKAAVFLTDGLPTATWAGTVKQVSYRGRDIQPRVDGQNFVAAIVEISVTYLENLSNPAGN